MGRITVPKAVREQAGLDIGDRVVIEARDGEIVSRKSRELLEFAPPAPRAELVPWSELRRVARDDRAGRRRNADSR